VNQNESCMTEKTIIRFPGGSTEGFIEFGCGVLADSFVNMSATFAGRTILMMVDPALVSMEWFTRGLQLLESRKIKTLVHSEIESDPTVAGFEAVARIAYSEKPALVIGLGGGSTLDTAKMVAIAAGSGLSVREILLDPTKISSRVPLWLAPTTSGTGSEISPYIVVSDEGKKLFIEHKAVYADKAIVDPLTTVSMPPRLTAFTGLDALTHAIEGASTNNNPFTRALTRESARLIIGNLPSAIHDGTNLVSRINMAYASVLGMLAYIQGGGLYAHSMSYVLTRHAKFPHGLGCAVALPYTVRFNELYISDVIADLSEVFTQQLPNFTGDVPKALHHFIGSIGVPVSLHEAGIDETMIPEFSRAMVEQYPRTHNPRKLTPELSTLLVKAMFNNTI
jgi:alcohol dehydrogenase class IV